jgi:hypothetical protein
MAIGEYEFSYRLVLRETALDHAVSANTLADGLSALK